MEEDDVVAIDPRPLSEEPPERRERPESLRWVDPETERQMNIYLKDWRERMFTFEALQREYMRPTRGFH